MGEFQELMVRPDAVRMMASVGVDVIALADFSDFLFADNDQITFVSLLELVLQLRGTNQATVKDIVDLRKFFRQDVCNTLSARLDKFQEENKAFWGRFENDFKKLSARFPEGMENGIEKNEHKLCSLCSESLTNETSFDTKCMNFAGGTPSSRQR